MKKSISKLLAIILSILFIFQTSVVALADNGPDWEDVNWSQEEFEKILNNNSNSQISPLASGLINKVGLSIVGSAATLKIAGITQCAYSVVKCGFTVVTIKRRASSSASWSTYKTYDDLYNDSNSYSLGKSLTVPKGYQWRVYCTHYAKKSLFSTEKIDNSSNILTIS